jgi:hypothetical protein
MNQLQVNTPTTTGTSIALRPAAATRADEDRVATYRNRLDRDGGPGVPATIRSDRAPTVADRTAMEGRLADLRAGLRPEPDSPEARKARRDVFLALLGGFPTYGVDSRGATALADLYGRAVSDLPLWAVREAAGRFLSARTLNEWGGERLTPPIVAKEARRGLDVLYAEIEAIREVLDARVYTPISDAQRKAVLDKIAEAPNSLLVAAKDRPVRPAADAVEEARAANVEQSRAAFAVAAGGGDLSRLMGRLDAKVPRQGAEVGA